LSLTFVKRFLITSNTPEKRIRQIDEASSAFIYAVSMAGVTGKNLTIDNDRREYLKRLKKHESALANYDWIWN
jgi:tryptophan synthase alpha chain